MDSAFILYREGNSQAEFHSELADFIFFREGEGAVIIGGKVVNGRSTSAGEIRGDSIAGGTKYAVGAGDSIYVPKGTPHQFWLEPGQHFTATIVKITPQEYRDADCSCCQTRMLDYSTRRDVASIPEYAPIFTYNLCR